MERIWLRLGVTIETSQEKMREILSGNRDVLQQVINDGEFVVDGETYIPDFEVEEYNEDNGTDFKVEDKNFELYNY
jgi:hypothetical protein